MGSPLSVERLLLHPGSPKTATSSIQNYLFKCRQDLAAKGILYPSAGMLKTGGAAKGHHALALSLDSGDAKNPCLNGMLDDLEKEIRASPCETLLLSSEEFFGSKRLAKFSELIKADRVEVVVFLRPQIEVINANYYTQVTYNRIADLPESYAKSALSNLRYLEVLDAIKVAFKPSKLNVLRFEKGSKARADPIGTLIQSFDLPLDQNGGVSQRDHPTLAAEPTQMLRLLNEVGVGQDEFFRLFQRTHRLAHIFEGEMLSVPPELARELEESYAGENEQIRETYFPDESGQLFAPAELPSPKNWAAAVGSDHLKVAASGLERIFNAAVSSG